MNNNQDYILRITNATPLGLIIINYDLVLDAINAAIAATEGEKTAYEANVQKARDFLMELITSLDFKYEISRDLHTLYMHVNRLLTGAMIYSQKEKLAEAAQIMSTLKTGWESVKEEPDAQKVYENAQKVYSGLTYGKKGANEYVETEGNRGFKA